VVAPKKALKASGVAVCSKSVQKNDKSAKKAKSAAKPVVPSLKRANSKSTAKNPVAKALGAKAPSASKKPRRK